MGALIIKEFRELARDRRTLAMLIALPIVLLVIFGYAANFTVDRVSVTVIGTEAESVNSKLLSHPAAERMRVVSVDPGLPADRAEQLLRDRTTDAVIVALPGAGSRPDPSNLQVYIDGSNLFTAQAAHALFVPMAAQVAVLFNPDLTTSWVMVPGLMGLILTFIGTLITSIGLVRERESGTLEQLAVMPLRPGEIILGKLTPYFLLAVVDMAIVTVLAVWLFDVPFVGNPWLFALTTVVFCFVVLGMGTLISSVSQNTGQAIQLAIMFVVPQVLLSGLIFPLDAMPIGVRWIGYLLPLTWFREIAQAVMLRGAGLNSWWPALAVLMGMAAVTFGAATLRMRRSLTRPGAH